MSEDLVREAREVVMGLGLDALSDEAATPLLTDARDWLVTFAEWTSLERHLLRTADRLVDEHGA